MIAFKRLKKLLNESLFNPKTATGPLKIILESGNKKYYESRALEYILEARNIVLDSDLAESQYHDKIKNAISLLLIARATVGEDK